MKVAPRLTSFLGRLKLSIFSALARMIYHRRRSEKVIIFESNSDFSDNPRALFDYMVQQGLDKKYQLVWIVKDMEVVKPFRQEYPNVLFIPFHRSGLNAGYLLMMYYFSIASFAFYSHKLIGIPYKKNQVRVFMTHAAVPVKDSRDQFWPADQNTYILSTSEFAAYYRCLSFRGGIERCRFLGFPRNDKLFLDGTELKKRLKLDRFRKLILWMPTFKHSTGHRDDFHSKEKKDISLLTAENLVVVNECLAQANIGLVIKFHPAQNLKFVEDVNMSHIVTIDNKKLISLNLPLYTLLGCADALMTDFSSVYFDYLLLDRPLAFELTDKESYASGIGFLMEEPLDFMPGSKIFSLQDLLKFIHDLDESRDPFRKEREILRWKTHNHLDGDASRRIVEYLKL